MDNRRRDRGDEWDYTAADDNSSTIPLERMFESGGQLLYDIAMSSMTYAQVAVWEKRKGGAEWSVSFNVWAGLFRRDYREYAEWAVDADNRMRNDVVQRLDAISVQHTRLTHDTAFTYWKRYYEFIRQHVSRPGVSTTFDMEHTRGDGTLISLSNITKASPFPNDIAFYGNQIRRPSLLAPRNTIGYVVPTFVGISDNSTYPGLSALESFGRVRERAGMFRIYVTGTVAAMEHIALNGDMLEFPVVPWKKMRAAYWTALGGFMVATAGMIHDERYIYVRPTLSTPTLVSSPLPCPTCVDAPVLMCEACRTPYCSAECGKRDACRK